MSVSDDYSIVSIVSTDDPIDITIPWEFGGITELEVKIQNDTTGAIQKLSDGDFTATLTEDGVQVENPYGSGTSVTVRVYRQTAKTQTYTPTESNPLDVEALAEALDKSIKLNQELAKILLDNAIISENVFEVPDKVTRADKIFKFDENGDPLFLTVGDALADGVGYAEEWANKTEDSLVSSAAGGDQADDYSALHHSAKANAQRVLAETAKTAAELAQTNAETAETNAASSASSASTDAGTATAQAVIATAQATAAANSALTAQSLNLLNSIWVFSSTLTDADPGSTKVRANNATLASVTEFYIDYEDKDAVDKSDLLAMIQTGYTLFIAENGNAANAALFTISTITDETGYYKLVVTLIASQGSLPDNDDELLFSVFPASSSGLSVAIYEDQKSSGTTGGNNSTGYQTRTLNTEVSDPDSIASLSSNAVTPIAGTYIVIAWAQGYMQNGHRLAIKDGTSNILFGVSNWHNAWTFSQVAQLTGVLVADGIKSYTLEHYMSLAQIDGFGYAATSGDSEVYSQLVLIRIGD